MDPIDLSNVVPILGASKQITNETLDMVMRALGATLQHLSALDASNAAANLAEVKPRPLTLLIMAAGDKLQEEMSK